MNFRLINRTGRGKIRKNHTTGIWGCLPFALAAVGPSFLAAEFRLTPESAESFFLVPNEEAVVVFLVEGDEIPSSLNFRVREYDGGERYRSSTSVGEEGIVELALDRRAGYHEIYFPETDQVFGLGALPPFEGETDDFFGIDAGLSWFAGEAVREELVANLARAGIGIARERFDWRAVNFRRGSWNWYARQTDFHPYQGGYQRVRMIYDHYGIDVVDPFFSAPAWSRTSEDPHAFPDDLFGTSDSWGTVATRWGDYLGGVEVWNKPDLDFGRFLPADQYVPLVRAVRHGIDRVAAGLPLGGGGFATVNRPYLDLAAHNELLEELDYVSFHFSGDPLWMEERVAAYREWLRDFDREAMPLWITESEASRAGLEGRSLVQVERTRAMRYVMNAVEAKASGVVRFFPGVYPHLLTASGINVGMTDEFGVPLRPAVTYFQAVRALSGREYAGDLSLPADNLRRARVFHREGEDALIVLYTGHPTWNQPVDLPFDISRAAGIDGRRLTPSSSRSVTVSDGLVYVWAEVSDVEEHLDRNTRAAGLYEAARAAPKERRPAASVILQSFPEFDGEAFANQVGYFVPENDGAFSLPVRVHNLDHRTVNLEVTVRELTGGDAGEVFGSESVTVPAGSFRNVVFSIPPDSLDPDSGLSRVAVRATGNGAGRVAPLVVNLLVPGHLDDLIARYSDRQSLPLRDLERRAQLSTEGEIEGITIFVTRDGRLRISGGFPEAGRSALSLDLLVPDDIRWDDVEALLLRVRFDRPTMARLGIRTDFGTTHYAVNRMIKKDGDWGVFLFPLNTDHFQVNHGISDLQVDRMRNGLFPLQSISLEFTHLDEEQSQNVLEIGDILFLGGRTETAD